MRYSYLCLIDCIGGGSSTLSVVGTRRPWTSPFSADQLVRTLSARTRFRIPDTRSILQPARSPYQFFIGYYFPSSGGEAQRLTDPDSLLIRSRVASSDQPMPENLFTLWLSSLRKYLTAFLTRLPELIPFVALLLGIKRCLRFSRRIRDAKRGSKRLA